MDRSAVLLPVDQSEAPGQEDFQIELNKLNGTPIIERVASTIGALVDEVIIVADSEKHSEDYARFVSPDVKIIVNSKEKNGSLSNAQAGFKISNGKYCLLSSLEFVLVSPNIVDLFFDLCQGKTAVIPRWPNQQLETLQAVYHVKTALEAGKLAIERGKYDLEAMVEHMSGVRYISTLALQEFDPELKTLFRARTQVDLRMAENLSKPRRIKPSKKR